MKLIQTKDAVGHILGHDLTQIIRGKSKGVRFKKGHRVTDEDIPVLLSMGKDHLYVFELSQDEMHEDEAATVLASFCMGPYMETRGISEGKIEIFATEDGFFQVRREMLAKINGISDLMIATRTGNLPVKKGDKLAGMRVIPLVIERKKMHEAQSIWDQKPILSITPFRKLQVGIVTTGSEVYYGRIQDTFTPVMKAKAEAFDLPVISHITCYDDKELIMEAIEQTREKGADIILCTGGMSVDPDDLTPAAIRDSGANIVSYGSPVLPGAMFLIGYYPDGKVALGVPGCAMFSKITVFDIIFPWIVAGIPISREVLAQLGYGGLCLGCDLCHYPNCEFGKGI